VSDTSLPGGGSGGAIYNDGVDMNLSICGSDLERNSIRDFGPAVFFVVDGDHLSGKLRMVDSRVVGNTGGGGVWQTVPGVSILDQTPREFVNTVFEP